MKTWIINILEAPGHRHLHTRLHRGTKEGAVKVAETLVREVRWNATGVTYSVVEASDAADR